jgi:general secretion pathway protein C
LTSCGGSIIDEPLRMDPVEMRARMAEMQPKEVQLKQAPPPGSLFRKDVSETVDEGLGYFLQRVSVDPSIVDGKFQGFRIVELRPAEFWKGVDLKPGDVVMQVNGMPIERDIDAYQAFESLRAAPELRVTFTRSGSSRQLVYAIVDPNAKAAPAKPANAAPAPAPAAPAPAAKPSTTG